MALLNREKQAAVQQLPIGEITPSPHQTRRDFHEEELAALATPERNLKAPQEAVLQALRHLPRNLSPEPLIREVALSLVS